MSGMKAFPEVGTALRSRWNVKLELMKPEVLMGIRKLRGSNLDGLAIISLSINYVCTKRVGVGLQGISTFPLRITFKRGREQRIENTLEMHT